MPCLASVIASFLSHNCMASAGLYIRKLQNKIVLVMMIPLMLKYENVDELDIHNATNLATQKKAKVVLLKVKMFKPHSSSV